MIKWQQISLINLQENNLAKKKKEHTVGLCLLCWKVPSKKDHVVSDDKDFVCSRCTQYLLEHPRKSGESLEDVLETLRDGKDEATTSAG